MPPSLKSDGIPSNHLHEFQQPVVTAVEPLVHCLLQNHDFILEITKTDDLGNTLLVMYFNATERNRNLLYCSNVHFLKYITLLQILHQNTL